MASVDVTDYDVPEDEMDLAEDLAELMARDPAHLDECSLCRDSANAEFDDLVDFHATPDELN